MKIVKYSLLMLCLVLAHSVFANPYRGNTPPENPMEKDISQEFQQMDVDELMTMNAAKYKKKYGKKLGLKNAIKLKATQIIIKRQMKKSKKAGSEGTTPEDLPKGLYVVLAIIGLGWLAMGLLSDWSGSDWIISLVLYILLWLPGLIYSLIKMSDYY